VVSLGRKENTKAMKLIDDILKIKAVVLYILQNMQAGVDYIHLFKTMYFAQQEHLVVYGLPLMNDSFVARKHGPVPSFTYKALRAKEGKVEDVTDEVSSFINDIDINLLNEHQIVSIHEGSKCDMDELSESNIEILDKWIAKCKDVETFELSDLSHDSAWKRANRRAIQTGEDTKIPLYDIAKAGNASKGMLEVIRERVSNYYSLQF